MNNLFNKIFPKLINLPCATIYVIVILIWIDQNIKRILMVLWPGKCAGGKHSAPRIKPNLT